MDVSVFQLESRGVLLLSIVVLWLGMFLTSKIKLLREYNIPAPVVGGLLCSLVIALLQLYFSLQISFDLMLRDLLLLVFFTTIGLSANFKLLLEGGKALTILTLLAVVFLVLQNLIGISVSTALGIDRLNGLLLGSASFAGGHGTGLTYASLFEQQFGLSGAVELAMACATFGLIAGGLTGGPLAKLLIKKHKITTPDFSNSSLIDSSSDSGNSLPVCVEAIINATFVLALCLLVGDLLHTLLSDNGITVPPYLPAMFAGIVYTNTNQLLGKKPQQNFLNCISLWGDISLTLFLSMTLMSMDLLSLAGAFGPILFTVLLQTAAVFLFCYFVVFNLMGKDYDAAIICAGFSGLGVGATPVGLANMRAVSSHYGNSAKAMLIIPLLGSFFLDIANAMVLQYFI